MLALSDVDTVHLRHRHRVEGGRLQKHQRFCSHRAERDDRADAGNGGGGAHGRSGCGDGGEESAVETFTDPRGRLVGVRATELADIGAGGAGLTSDSPAQGCRHHRRCGTGGFGGDAVGHWSLTPGGRGGRSARAARTTTVRNPGRGAP